MNTGDMFPLDVSKVKQEWVPVLTQVSSLEPLVLAHGIGNLTTTDKIHFCYKAWILHWLIKLEWNNQHKLPKYPKGHKETFKPLGELYRRVLHLCEKLHSQISNELLVEYPKATVWFGRIFQEGVVEGIPENKGKDFDLKLIQQQNKQISNYENPFSSTLYPATSLLFTLATRKAESPGNNAWSKNYFTPLLKARSAWVKELGSERWRSLRVVGDEVYIQQPGRGRAMRRVS